MNTSKLSLAVSVILTIATSQITDEEKKKGISDILQGVAMGAANTVLNTLPPEKEVPKNLLCEFDLRYDKRTKTFQ